VVFLAAMVGSFLIYNQVVKLITRKIDMESTSCRCSSGGLRTKKES
jgi:hypothetical protein